MNFHQKILLEKFIVLEELHFYFNQLIEVLL
jgi:hypothetical protein